MRRLACTACAAETQHLAFWKPTSKGLRLFVRCTNCNRCHEANRSIDRSTVEKPPRQLALFA